MKMHSEKESSAVNELEMIKMCIHFKLNRFTCRHNGWWWWSHNEFNAHWIDSTASPIFTKYWCFHSKAVHGSSTIRTFVLIFFFFRKFLKWFNKYCSLWFTWILFKIDGFLSHRPVSHFFCPSRVLHDGLPYQIHRSQILIVISP